MAFDFCVVFFPIILSLIYLFIFQSHFGHAISLPSLKKISTHYYYFPINMKLVCNIIYVAHRLITVGLITDVYKSKYLYLHSSFYIYFVYTWNEIYFAFFKLLNLVYLQLTILLITNIRVYFYYLTNFFFLFNLFSIYIFTIITNFFFKMFIQRVFKIYNLKQFNSYFLYYTFL